MVHTHTRTSFVTKPPFPPCSSLLPTCPITPLRSWVLTGAVYWSPSAQSILWRNGLPQTVTKLDLEQMFEGLAQHHTSCFGARAFVTDWWSRFHSFARLACGDEEGEGCYQLLGDKSSELLSVRSFLTLQLSQHLEDVNDVNSSHQRSSCSKRDLPIFLHLDLQWICEKGEGYAIELFCHWFLHHCQR